VTWRQRIQFFSLLSANRNEIFRAFHFERAAFFGVAKGILFARLSLYCERKPDVFAEHGRNGSAAVRVIWETEHRSPTREDRSPQSSMIRLSRFYRHDAAHRAASVATISAIQGQTLLRHLVLSDVLVVKFRNTKNR
jgi:hypothetical protein